MAYKESCNMLEVVAKKLGLSEEIIMKKATEISRLIEIKTSNQTLGLSVSGQNIMCLEIAAQQIGREVDRTLAIKLSGMSKRTYLQQLYTLERLLGLQPPSSIREMCIRLGCMELCPLAQRLLDRYQESSAWSKNEHPMYAAGAISAVARSQKVPMDKRKLAELGRARPSQLESVHNLLTKTLKQMGGVHKSTLKGSKSRGRTLLELISNQNEDAEVSSTLTSLTSNKNGDTEEQDYEDWKKKMLEEASSV